jgi:hypothetical protein
MPPTSCAPSPMDGDPGEGVDLAEIRAVLNEIENNDDGNQTAIIAVVAPEDRRPLNMFVGRMMRQGNLGTLRHRHLRLLYCT